MNLFQFGLQLDVVHSSCDGDRDFYILSSYRYK